jgi:hypothetical protein
MPFKGEVKYEYYISTRPHGLNVRGKAIPLQSWTCPEGARKLKLPDFKTIGT